MAERLCVIMPVYNEEAAIGGVLVKWAKALDALGLDYTIRPYNDGSKDSSLSVMRATAADLPRVDVKDKTNGGHGHTILTGYREAARDGFDWVFQVDSDDEMGPEKFAELWNAREEKDFLVGIRDGRRQALPRKVVSFVSRLCVRLFYGQSIWDVNTPYRLMRVSAFRQFFQEIPLTTFAPNVILSGLAARKHLRVAEILVPQHDRTTGEVSIKKWKLFKAAVKSFWQTITFANKSGLPFAWFVVGAILALVVRFSMSFLGSNYDFESYGIVADIVCRGGNVYAETTRYNYAPFWFNFLGLMKALLGEQMRVGIILLLSLTDIGIAALLWRRCSAFAAFLVLFSPISAFISGYHNQFDNIAVYITLLALVWADSQTQRGKDSLVPAIVIGLALIVKHLFIFLPFWFLFEKGCILRRRILKCAIPLLIFLLSFTPYVLPDAIRDVKALSAQVCEWNEGKEESLSWPQKCSRIREVVGRYYETTPSAFGGWMKNVIFYRSQQNGLSYRLGLGAFAMPIFVFGMIGVGLFLRKLSWFEQGLCYTVFLLLFTPAIADQYYIIPVAYCAAHIDIFSLLYNFGFVRVLGWVTSGKGNGFVVLLLAFSLFWTLFHRGRSSEGLSRRTATES